MAERIPLTRGQFALVDDEDLPLVLGQRWYANRSSTGQYYAINGQRLGMHRLITNCPKGLEVDHINHDTLDNRRSNLRVCTHKENMRNGKYALATECPRGHVYTPENTYLDRKGRRCKACNAQRAAWHRALETPEQREERKRYFRDYFQKRKAS